jgi:dihydroorotase
MSTAGTARIVAAAKEEGVRISCEVTPHHLFLTDEAIRGYDTATKVNPPLRAESDRLAMIDALRRGVVDCIATDHAPHGLVDKDVEYDRAAFGISGLETSLGLCLRLVHDGIVTPMRLVELMSTRPAALAGLPAGTLAVGSAADLVLVDPGLEWVVDPAAFLSLGKNTPFAGTSLKGRALLTLVGGREAYRHPGAAARIGREKG